MLRSEPRLHQELDFGAWAGTARDLARTVAGIRGLLPNATFKATVYYKSGDVAMTEDPEGLADLTHRDRIQRIMMVMEEHRDSPSGHEFLYVLLFFGPSNTRKVLVCHTANEIETRALVESARDRLRANRPWYGWLYSGGPVREYLTTMAVWSALVLPLLTSMLIRPEKGLVPAITFVGTIVLSFAFLALFLWLLPEFEIYAEKPRLRRFMWGVISLVLIPLAFWLLPQGPTDQILDWFPLP